MTSSFNQPMPANSKKPPGPAYGSTGQYKDQRDAPGGNLGDKPHSGRSAGDEPDEWTAGGGNGGQTGGNGGNNGWDDGTGTGNGNNGWGTQPSGDDWTPVRPNTIEPDPSEPNYSADVWEYIHYAASRSDQYPSSNELSRRISECRGNVNPRSSVCQYTPLHVAVKFVQISAVRQLLAAGADVNAQDVLGQTPLSLACCYGGGTEIPQLLLNDRRTNTEIVDRYTWTALFWAASHGFYHVSKLLVDRGANRNVRDKRGQRPADRASNDYIRNEIQ